MQRQVYSEPAKTAEEADRRNAPPAITSGYVWIGANQIAWIKDGDVFSVKTQKKFATLDQVGNLIALDGQPLNVHLETINGGGRIGAGKSTDAIAKFQKLATKS